MTFVEQLIKVFMTDAVMNQKQPVDKIGMKKIYAASNPMWYADTFIFSYMEDLGCYVYVKVNSDNKIEEIGINLERRTHNTRFEDMDKTEASRLQKSIFNRIGKEYWWGLYNQYQRNSNGN